MHVVDGPVRNVVPAWPNLKVMKAFQVFCQMHLHLCLMFTPAPKPGNTSVHIALFQKFVIRTCRNVTWHQKYRPFSRRKATVRK